jgi:hypothetical protein
MAPKKRTLLKGENSKGKSGSSDKLNTANDYVEATDEFESAMRKWRAGDAEKALRFYNRACLVYEEGLRKFPTDFDLAYNRAHLQIQVATDHRLLKALITIHRKTEIGLLQQALESHRYALNLDQGNAEILYNTATVLTTLAEKLSESSDDDERITAIKLLQEAIELFSSCLTRQEFNLEEFQSMQNEANENMAEDKQEQAAGDEIVDSVEEAEVVEPITPMNLIDTASAEISAITTLVTNISPELIGHANVSSTLASLAELGTSILSNKVPIYLDLLSKMPFKEQKEPPQSVRVLSVTTSKIEIETNLPERSPFEEAQSEVAIVSVTFYSNLAEAEYTNKLTTYQAYAHRIHDIFQSDAASREESNTEFLWARATAYDTLAASLLVSKNDIKNADALLVAWNALPMAEASITQALQRVVQEDLVGKQTTRTQFSLLAGDLALHKRRLLMLSNLPSDVDSNGLLSAALQFYRTAEEEAGRAKAEDTHAEAKVKRIMIESDGNPTQEMLFGLDLEEAQSIVEDMVDQGLIQKCCIGVKDVEWSSHRYPE